MQRKVPASGSFQRDAESASAVHEARREIGAAFKDATDIFQTGKVTAGTLLPRIISFLQTRLETVRQALNQFMEGYSEGLKEVRALIIGPQQLLRSTRMHESLT